VDAAPGHGKGAGRAQGRLRRREVRGRRRVPDGGAGPVRRLCGGVRPGHVVVGPRAGTGDRGWRVPEDVLGRAGRRRRGEQDVHVHAPRRMRRGAGRRGRRQVANAGMPAGGRARRDDGRSHRGRPRRRPWRRADGVRVEPQPGDAVVDAGRRAAGVRRTCAGSMLCTDIVMYSTLYQYSIWLQSCQWMDNLP